MKAMGIECDNDEFHENLPFSYSSRYSKVDNVAK
jgi:hypothetical protein